MPLIELKDFSFKYYGAETLALKKIDLSIEEGEYVVITGPSGCGKTTLCRTINALVPQFHRGYIAGNVIIDGKNTRENTVAELSSIAGLVFQQPENQLVTLNVEKEIAFGPENLGIEPTEIRRRVEELIELLDLEHLREKHPHEMSGGEQQRVAMAATLALKPKILVADEPTSNLDPEASKMVKDLIKELSKKVEKTVFICSHMLPLVEEICDRIGIIVKGNLLFVGTIPEILAETGSQTLEEAYLKIAGEKATEKELLAWR